MIDDFDWDWEKVGGFWDYMTDQEAEDERFRRKLEKEMLNPDDCELDDDDEPEP